MLRLRLLIENDIVWNVVWNAVWSADRNAVDNLMKFTKTAFDVDAEAVKCIDRFDNVKKTAFWRLNALTDWRFCQKIASDVETIKCINEFSNFVKKLHLTLKQSNALTNFRVFVKKLHLILKQSNALTNLTMSENCIWRWNDQM